MIQIKSYTVACQSAVCTNEHELLSTWPSCLRVESVLMMLPDVYDMVTSTEAAAHFDSTC